MIGKVLGERYEIMELVGSGGMAYVYKARCRLLNRNVAIKILKEEFNNDTDFVSKFYVESQSAASLSNVNIVSVYDVGEQDDLKYIVMEYVEGITLKEIIKQQRILEWNVAVNCCLQILNALECAHKNGIVHRDIKPHNILVTNDGVLKVADFGIAKAVNKSETKKIDEDVVGSVHYISPEQAKGIMIDSRSDLYSLGIVMYEMLTGKLPFDGENPVSVALMHLNSEPVPIKDVNIAVPLELSQIVKKAMARDVSQRYQSAKEMAHDLIEFKKHMKNNAFTTNKNADELAQNPIDVPNDMKSDSESDENEIFKTIVRKPFEEMKGGESEKTSGDTTATEVKDEEVKQNTDEKTKENDKKDKENKKPKTKEEKSAVIAAIVVSVLIIAGMFAVFANIFFKGTPFLEFFSNVFRGKEYYLADFTGKDYNETIEILDNDGIEYTISSEEKNDEYEDNVILRQDPVGGKNIKLKKDTVIKFVVNNIDDEDEKDNEKTKVRVPAVVGQEFSKAEKMITELGLKCVKETSDASEGDENYVIRQSPESGEMLSKGSTVIVFVPEVDEGIMTVSKYTGMEAADAKRYAELDGLEVELKNRETKEEAEDGFVLEQSITHGTEVEKGAKIIFYVGVYRAEGETEGNQSNENSGNSNSSEADNSSGGNVASEEEFLPETKTKHIRVPIASADKDRTVTVLQDGVKISSIQFKAGSTNLPLTISGSGVSKIEIIADGVVVYTGTYDFSR